MLPTEILPVAAVLVLLAPGCVWAVAHRANRSTPVRDIAAIVLVGTVCSAAAIGVVALVRALQPSLVMDYGAWVRTGDYYLHRSYPAILQTVGIELGVACALAGLLAAIANERAHVRGARAETSTLVRLVQGEEATTRAQPGSQPRVFVRMHDGTLYEGTFYALDAGPAVDRPVLALSAPIVFQRVGERSAAMPPTWDRIALPMADVAELWTSSRLAEQAPVADAPRDGETDGDTDGDEAADAAEPADAADAANPAEPAEPADERPMLARVSTG